MRWRDLRCGEVRPEQVGRRIALAGWVDTRRDHGGLVFVDLRDRAGLCQLVINPERAPEAHAAMHEVRNEFVLRAEGEVVARAPEAVNPELPTGAVELQVDRLEIVSRCPPLPFQLDEENVDETLRFRYRWLDLRRERLQRNIALRAQMVGIIRRVMEAAEFLDIQTPILFKPTPEGARDFVVPSRLHRGRFYALPQSPQILKQLLMVAGFDRYYQIAICFRDEDLRADRVQEITQLDVEMSFPDLEFIVGLMERMCVEIWRDCIGVDLHPPFPRMTYADAMARYGTDKPDLRFGLEIQDATELTRGSGFEVFAQAPLRAVSDRSRATSPGPSSPSSRSARRSGGRRVSPTSSSARTAARCAPRSRSSSRRTSLPSSTPGRARPCSSAPTTPRRSRACSAHSATPRASLGLTDRDADVFVWVFDFPLFDWSRKRAAGAFRPPPVHGARLPSGRSGLDHDPGMRPRSPMT